MDTTVDFDLSTLPGYRWMENGQSVFSGKLRELYTALDQLFVRLAADCGAEEYFFPIFLPATQLAKLDYFRSFPHLATFACTLDPAKENLAAFSKSEGINAHGEVTLTKTAPVKDVLTPAACYHVYLDLQGSALEAPRHVTTRCTCFRREAYYAPMQRQWAFGMREIVCVGSADEVKGFLERYRARVTKLVVDIGLPIDWIAATDPFFNAAANPKFLAQKIEPVKTEMIYGGSLAIGSVNFHRNFFGETFEITRAGAHAFSGCVAFGIERWIYAVLRQFGTDAARWPDFASMR